MLTIQTVAITGCIDSSNGVSKITTEMTTESITQAETIQTELQETESSTESDVENSTENNIQIELPDIVQTINESDYEPFDMSFDEFVKGFNHYTENNMTYYTWCTIYDEDTDFYDATQTNNCNVYVIHIGDSAGSVMILDMVVYCSSQDKNEILNIQFFTKSIEEVDFVKNRLYGDVADNTIAGIICSINADLFYDDAGGVIPVFNDLFENIGEVLTNEVSYRGYVYTLVLNMSKQRFEFDTIKEKE